MTQQEMTRLTEIKQLLLGLRNDIVPFVLSRLQKAFPDDWTARVLEELQKDERKQTQAQRFRENPVAESLDILSAVSLTLAHYKPIFADVFRKDSIHDLRKYRNQESHDEPFSEGDYLSCKELVEKLYNDMGKQQVFTVSPLKPVGKPTPLAKSKSPKKPAAKAINPPSESTRQQDVDYIESVKIRFLLDEGFAPIDLDTMDDLTLHKLRLKIEKKATSQAETTTPRTTSSKTTFTESDLQRITSETAAEIKSDNAAHNERLGIKPGKNDPCPCGSGKKYKYCCGKNVT